MHADETALLAAIAADPANADGWLVLADWLDERDDPRGELVRLCHALRTGVKGQRGPRETRVRALLAAGVRHPSPEFANGLGARFRLFPPGTFRMGAPNSEPGRRSDELPRHRVTLTKPFYLAVFPVTQAEYRAVTGQSPSTYGSTGRRADAVAGIDADRLPVESVSWGNATSFCRRLSARPEEKAAGRKYRLPTEAEWEYACRGAGTLSTPFPWGNDLDATRANFRGSVPYRSKVIAESPERPSVVGSYPADLFGLFDMQGNVWEWCADRYGPYPETAQTDPCGSGDGTDERRVLRGCCWYAHGTFLRAACRVGQDHNVAPDTFGFRLALDVPTVKRRRRKREGDR